MEILEEIRALFHDDRLVEAYSKLQQAEQAGEEVVEALEVMPEIPIIKESVRCLNVLLGELGDLNSWNLVYEENDVATFSKGGGSDFFLRGEVVMHNGLFPA